MPANPSFARGNFASVQWALPRLLVQSITWTLALAAIDALQTDKRHRRVLELDASWHSWGEEEVCQDSDCDWSVRIPPNCDFYPRPDPWHSIIEPLAAIRLDFELFRRW